MNITSHSVCMPVVNVLDDGRLLTSRMTYTKRGSTTIRHILETGKNGQSVLETLEDGVRREGAKDKTLFSFSQLSAEPIHIEFGRDQAHLDGVHMKLVFPVFVEVVMLRDYEAPDDDDPDEIHGPISMVEIRELIHETRGRTIPFHFRGTLAVARWAALQQESTYNLYEDLYHLADCELVGYELTEQQKMAIAHYKLSW